MTEPAGALPPFTTPALIVDLDVFEANVGAMQHLLHGTGKTVRPHMKTHRTPELARRQLGGSAVGITCATVGEAEVMVAAGIDDVFVANEIVEPAKIERLVSLAHAARVAVAADDPDQVDRLSRAAAAGGVTVQVLLDVDIGLHRCGLTSAEEAVALAAVVERLPGVRLGGIMGYEGRLRLTVEDRDEKIDRAYATLAEVRAGLLAAGFPVDVVSASGTSTLSEAIADPTITELQSGVYCLMEPELLVMDLPFRCAVTVRGTVISRHPGRAVLDIGRRVVGLENGPPVPAGFTASRVAVNDEHTILALDDPVPALGSNLDLVPGQIRTTSNLHDWIWVSRGGRILDRWPVTARGRSW